MAVPSTRASFRSAPCRAPAAALLLLLGACSGNYSPDTYATRAVQQANKVEQGTIVGARQVEVRADGTAGAAAGAAAGGVAGSQIGQGSAAAAFGAIGGGLVGGLLGSAAERAAGDATATEYIVRKGNGDLLSVTQKDATPLALGQKVLVITGIQARIVPDYTVAGEPATADGAAGRNGPSAGGPANGATAASDASPSGGSVPDAAARAEGTAATAPPVVPVERSALPPLAPPAGDPEAVPPAAVPSAGATIPP